MRRMYKIVTYMDGLNWRYMSVTVPFVEHVEYIKASHLVVPTPLKNMLANLDHVPMQGDI